MTEETEVPNIVIVPEDDVPAPETTRRRKADIALYAQALKRLEIGHTFFIAGYSHKETKFLYRIAQQVGIKLTAKEVKCDEVYQCAGIRFWRVEDRDELSPEMIVSDEFKERLRAAEEEGL